MVAADTAKASIARASQAFEIRNRAGPRARVIVAVHAAGVRAATTHGELAVRLLRRGAIAPRRVAAEGAAMPVRPKAGQVG
jgi:hypothetical protein